MLRPYEANLLSGFKLVLQAGFMVLAALSLISALSAAAPEDAPTRVVPKYAASCPQCPASGISAEGFYRFWWHVEVMAPTADANRLFQRETVARVVGLTGAVTGLVAASAFVWLPWSCTGSTSSTPGQPACVPGDDNYTALFLGAGLLAGGYGAYRMLRPSEAEAVSTINRFNEQHPEAMFYLDPVDAVAPVVRAYREEPLPVVVRKKRQEPRILQAPVLIPLVIGTGSALVSGFMYNQSREKYERTRVAPLPSVDSAQVLLESGQRSQWMARGFAAASAVALGTSAWFYFRPRSEGATATILPGPGSVVITGSWE